MLIQDSMRATCCLAMLGCFCLLGCNSKAPTNVVMESSAPKAPVEPAEVKLSEPELTVSKEGMLKFKVKYEFTKGSPVLNYMCNLNFPGTSNSGQKPLQHWELKQSGIIKGAIELQSLEPPVKEFELSMGEAEVPQSGFQTISNKLTGEVTYVEQ